MGDACGRECRGLGISPSHYGWKRVQGRVQAGALV
jgi:hypothetical protein